MSEYRISRLEAEVKRLRDRLNDTHALVNLLIDQLDRDPGTWVTRNGLERKRQRQEEELKASLLDEDDPDGNVMIYGTQL